VKNCKSLFLGTDAIAAEVPRLEGVAKASSELACAAHHGGLVSVVGVAKVLLNVSEEALYREASVKVTLVMDMMLPPTLREKGRATERNILKLDYVRISAQLQKLWLSPCC